MIEHIISFEENEGSRGPRGRERVRESSFSMCKTVRREVTSYCSCIIRKNWYGRLYLKLNSIG